MPASDPSPWFRGQLHVHSYWSDGRGFPEQAAAAYKQRGYHFVCLTEHNVVADDKAKWRPVANEEGKWPPNVTRAIYDDYVRAFGKDWVESRIDGTGTSVRLRTVAEVMAKFNEPGRFMLLPGMELTQTINGRDVHANTINLSSTLPCIAGAGLLKKVTVPETASGLIALNEAEAQRAASGLHRQHLFMLNHPFWVYYNVVPQDLIDNPAVRFFEICCGGSEYAPPPQAPNCTIERFWDAVNAFRLIRGHPLLYGIGSDDAHFYDSQRIDGPNGVGDAWIMVRAGALTPELVIAAMHRGDFYASCGVSLEDVSFDPTSRTLHVKILPEPGASYRIHFITTKRGFDQTVRVLESPAERKRPARSIPVYSEDIGRTAITVPGTEASYRLTEDDLYVRARVESDRPSKLTRQFHPDVQTAWTQPYAVPGTHAP